MAQSSVCPRCDKMVEPEWRLCPHCEAVLLGPRRGARSRCRDDGVRRDRAGTSVILILLAALGGIGLVAYLWAALSALSEGVWGFLAAGILVLLFISLIAGVVTFHRARYDPNQWGVGRVIVRTLVLTGGLVGLFCVLGLALFLLLFIVCWTSRTPGGKLIGRTPDRIQENNNAANYMYAVKAQVVDFRFCPCRRAHLHKLPGRDCESARDG